LSQAKENPPFPPVGVTVAIPLFSPLQTTGESSITEQETIFSGSLIVMEH